MLLTGTLAKRRSSARKTICSYDHKQTAPLVVLVMEGGEPRERLVRAAGDAGFVVLAASRTALIESRTSALAVVIIAADLVDGDLLSFCATFRQRRRGGLIIVGPHLDPVDVASIIEAGADDYAPSTVSARELTARARAITRARSAGDRRPGRFQLIIKVGKLTIDLIGGKVSGDDGRHINLSHPEVRVLFELLSQKNVALSRARLCTHSGLPAGRRRLREIDVLVCRMRKKLAAITDQSLIRTCRKQGYLLDWDTVGDDGEGLPSMLDADAAWSADDA